MTRHGTLKRAAPTPGTGRLCLPVPIVEEKELHSQGDPEVSLLFFPVTKPSIEEIESVIFEKLTLFIVS